MEWQQNVAFALKRIEIQDSNHAEEFKRITFIWPYREGGASQKNDWFRKSITRAQSIIRSAIHDFEFYGEKSSISSVYDETQPLPNKRNRWTRKIFVVHGHDNEMKLEVARFIEKLEFEAIILHERPNGGKTIIEKFEEHASEVSYAVVLLSPDDLGAVKADENEQQTRARQNVIYELGFFAGKLGRSKVCLLKRGSVEFPSDLSGVVYVPFEGESWKLKLSLELDNAGLDVDLNKAYK